MLWMFLCFFYLLIIITLTNIVLVLQVAFHKFINNTQHNKLLSNFIII